MSKSSEHTSIQDVLFDILNGRVIPDLVCSLAESSFEDRDFRQTYLHGKIGSKLSPSDVATAAYLLSIGEQADFARLIDGYLADGCGYRELYLILLTDCARILGQLWCEDDCSFAEVTLGMTFLHSLVRKYRESLALELPQIDRPGKVFLASMPGDTHIFGVTMLQSFFSAAGWQTRLELDEPAGFLQEKAVNPQLDLVCLSVSCFSDLENCRKIINAIRENRFIRGTKILVGGKVFMDNPTLVRKIDADGMACDALEALYVSSGLLKRVQTGSRQKVETLS